MTVPKSTHTVLVPAIHCRVKCVRPPCRWDLPRYTKLLVASDRHLWCVRNQVTVAYAVTMRSALVGGMLSFCSAK